MSFKSSGFLGAAKVLRTLRESPGNGTTIQQSCIRQKNLKVYSKEEALALYIDMRLSTRKYNLMQKGSKIRGAPLYPSYNRIAQAKNECYPQNDQVHISETGFSKSFASIIEFFTNPTHTEALHDNQMGVRRGLIPISIQTKI